MKSAQIFRMILIPIEKHSPLPLQNHLHGHCYQRDTQLLYLTAWKRAVQPDTKYGYNYPWKTPSSDTSTIVAGILHSIHQICPKLSCKIFHQDIPSSHPPIFFFGTYLIQSSTEVLLWCTHFGSPFWCLSALAALFQSGPWQHNRVTFFGIFSAPKGGL